MKSVLISIKPKYCELIANGKKTVEVRKTIFNRLSYVEDLGV
jgi:predicted transcriptional regulator